MTVYSNKRRFHNLLIDWEFGFKIMVWKEGLLKKENLFVETVHLKTKKIHNVPVLS